VEGYETPIAADLNAAFAAVRGQPPDVVLLDVQLGTDDGLLLASWMLEQPVLCLIPVIAVTAQAMVTERQRILASGCRSVVQSRSILPCSGAVAVLAQPRGSIARKSAAGKKVTIGKAIFQFAKRCDSPLGAFETNGVAPEVKPL